MNDTTRSDKDYAIEHAAYMATDAERLLAAIEALSAAELRLEESGEDDDGTVADARDNVWGATRSLRSGIYEFRKRRDRAALGGAATPAPAVMWEPQFDAISHEQEQLVLKFCAEIAGPRGQKGSPPDPVRLLEMAEALYLAERKDAAPAAVPVQPAEPAPPNSLPSWDECALRVSNSDFIAKRVAEGGYGADEDSLLAKELHRFINEYDDADPYRSAWFLHRLELLLEETKKEALAATPAAVQQGREALSDDRVLHIFNHMGPRTRDGFHRKVADARAIDFARAIERALAPTPQAPQPTDLHRPKALPMIGPLTKYRQPFDPSLQSTPLEDVGPSGEPTDSRTRPLTDPSQPWTPEHCKAYPRRASEEIEYLRGRLAAASLLPAQAVPLTDERINDLWHLKVGTPAAIAVRIFARAIEAELIGSASTSEPPCKKCGGTGVVDDGEIDCYPDGTPYSNGPVKCVKDCPACASTSEPAPQAVQAQALEVLWDIQSRTPRQTGFNPPVIRCRVCAYGWAPEAPEQHAEDCLYDRARTLASASDAAKQQDPGSFHLTSSVPSETVQTALSEQTDSKLLEQAEKALDECAEYLESWKDLSGGTAYRKAESALAALRVRLGKESWK
jgi:hypothetical protein